jgi:hypothetical protein
MVKKHALHQRHEQGVNRETFPKSSARFFWAQQTASESPNMEPVDNRITARRRARLAEKGRVLYHKSCGAIGGKKSCAESFALHHIGRGEREVARDLLEFLESEAEALRLDDPDGRLPPTEELAARIRRHLDTD